MTKIIVIAAFILTGATAFTYKDEEPQVQYPEGFRQWAHIKTGLIGPKSPSFASSGGFHHIYANDKALEGYRTGEFPEGSILVFDVLDAVYKDDSNVLEGSRNHVDVMIKDSRRFATTGGWGFEEFKGDSQTERLLNGVTKGQCNSCHLKQKDYVFSEMRK